MVIKLMILAIFVFIYFYRLNAVWLKYRDDDSHAYVEVSDSFYSIWWVAERVFTFMIVIVFLRSATPLFAIDIAWGMAIMFVGVAITCYGRICLRHSWANIGEITRDKKPLVDDGIYHYVRNPIYVGLTLMALGRVIAMGAMQMDIIQVLAIVTLFITIVSYHYEIVQEERFLLERYGKDYEDYRQTAGRYLPHLHVLVNKTKLGLNS